MKKYYELDRQECIDAITAIIHKISDLWILWQIYRMITNVTRE